MIDTKKILAELEKRSFDVYYYKYAKTKKVKVVLLDDVREVLEP